MINHLKLSYFRQHIEREFRFGAGINAIRGENEAGKTTVLEAFAYLTFGARALRESLDEVVTYHQPVSKLRVEGSLTHLGVEYKAYRAKSGAEVTFGNERITGQTEVTRFFEQLFGADAEMAGKLMVANQKSLADSLTAGPAEAGRMIEDLANFSLIDEIVELAQAKLVSGVTTGVDARIAQLREQSAEAAAVKDLEPLRLEVGTAGITFNAASVAVANLRTRRDDLDVDLAKSILADEKRLQATITTATDELAQLDGRLAVEPPVAPASAELDAARAAVEAEKQYARSAAIHAELTKAKIEDMWDKDLVSLEAEIVETKGKADAAEARRQAAAAETSKIDSGLHDLHRSAGIQTATLEGKLIKETSCAFCDKDLTDVPEVVQRNSSIGKELKAHLEAVVAAGALLDQQRAAQAEVGRQASAEWKEADNYFKDLQAVITRNSAVENLYAKAGDLITVDRSTVPGLWTWAGPAISDARENVAAALAQLERRQKEATAFEATRAALQQQRDALKVKQDVAVLERSGLQIKDANETLVDAAALDTQITAAGEVLAEARAALTQAEGALATEVALQKASAAAAELTKKQLKAAEQELVEMQSNNALIKKVRTARPFITDKLWSIVLAGVSHHFSDVRGESSSITRSDKAFRCNGHPAAGLSGSAQDMLGLSMRIALTKTFIPGCGFLLLDEPAAACSDYRETAMLGMLATLGFDQIIMVTHSTLADAFADNIVTI